jgi:predicted RNase H-like HicB family nuclease
MTKQRFRIPIRVVLYREDKQWVAHCLEFDVIGSGDSQDDALEDLNEVIRIQIDESFRNGCMDNLFHPADGETLSWWAAGEQMPHIDRLRGILKVAIGGVTIPGADAREFNPRSLESSNHDLVPA